MIATMTSQEIQPEPGSSQEGIEQQLTLLVEYYGSKNLREALEKVVRRLVEAKNPEPDLTPVYEESNVIRGLE